MQELDDRVMAYLNDVLPYPKSRENPPRHRANVLEGVREHRLFLQLPKCECDKGGLEKRGNLPACRWVYVLSLQSPLKRLNSPQRPVLV